MDEIWQRDEIDSPCVKICVVHPDAKICIGCFRTIDEIRDWSLMTPAQRREIMETLATREPRLRGTRKGRQRRLGAR